MNSASSANTNFCCCHKIIILDGEKHWALLMEKMNCKTSYQAGAHTRSTFVFPRIYPKVNSGKKRGRINPLHFTLRLRSIHFVEYKIAIMIKTTKNRDKGGARESKIAKQMKKKEWERRRLIYYFYLSSALRRGRERRILRCEADGNDTGHIACHPRDIK